MAQVVEYLPSKLKALSSQKERKKERRKEGRKEGREKGRQKRRKEGRKKASKHIKRVAISDFQKD
jgi:flagellar biosynthesis/type III secretory pathway protein FliH